LPLADPILPQPPINFLERSCDCLVESLATIGTLKLISQDIVKMLLDEGRNAVATMTIVDAEERGVFAKDSSWSDDFVPIFLVVTAALRLSR
jgi:hypothetical protein